jgi:hypothetical protein
MKLILTIILMNGSAYSFHYKVNKIDAYYCDALFDKYTYVNTSTANNGRPITKVYYKSQEVLGHICHYKST